MRVCCPCSAGERQTERVSILSRCLCGCHQFLDHGIHIILVIAVVIWRLDIKRGQNLSRPLLDAFADVRMGDNIEIASLNTGIWATGKPA